MIKRIYAVILSLVIVISCLPLGAVAVENDKNTYSGTNTVIYVENTYCIVGKTVNVNINVSNNFGIAGTKFTVSYGNDLTLVSVTEEGGAFEALDYTAPEALSSPCLFNWDSLDSISNDDGTIITLTFEVSSEVQAGEKLDINISCNYGDIYDADLKSVAVTVISGSLDVINYIPGDVNGDDVVNGKDVTLIRRYNAGGFVDINALAADVNGDGVINGKDVTLIRRYNANWNITLSPGKVLCEHSLTSVNAKAPTCTEGGNIEYWHCTKCGKYFADEAGSNEISLESTVLSATGHSYAKAWSSNANYHWHSATCGHTDMADYGKHDFDENNVCTVCGYTNQENYYDEYQKYAQIGKTVNLITASDYYTPMSGQDGLFTDDLYKIRLNIYDVGKQHVFQHF